MDTYEGVPWKRMEKSQLNKFLMKQHKMGTSMHKHGSGRPRTMYNEQCDRLKACELG